MPVKKKRKTQKQHKDRIDRVFHRYIRLRDVNDQGYGKCISCSKAIHFDESDAGHCISRSKLATRWNEDNVNIQCRKCNRFEYGRQLEYSINIGLDKAEELLQLSRSLVKFTDSDFIELYEKFNSKLKELEKKRNF